MSLKITGNHWVRTDTKVNPFRPIQAALQTEIDDDALENWPFMGQRINHSFPAIRAPQVDGPAYIAQTFAEVAAAKLNEYHLTKTHAPLVRDAVCGYMMDNKTKKYIVELDDFLPANNNPNCTTFHVYGKILSVESGTPMEHAAIHWFLYNKTAAEALDYVTSGFYEIEFAACRLHTFNDKICIVAVMANNVVHIPAIETLVQ